MYPFRFHIKEHSERIKVVRHKFLTHKQDSRTGDFHSTSVRHAGHIRFTAGEWGRVIALSGKYSVRHSTFTTI